MNEAGPQRLCHSQERRRGMARPCARLQGMVAEQGLALLKANPAAAGGGGGGDGGAAWAAVTAAAAAAAAARVTAHDQCVAGQGTAPAHGGGK